MTEIQKIENQEKLESANTLTPQQQFEQVKNALKTEIALNYKNLVNAITNAESILINNFKFHFNSTIKSHAFLNLDQGVMWLEKCFDVLHQMNPFAANGLAKETQPELSAKKKKK